MLLNKEKNPLIIQENMGNVNRFILLFISVCALTLSCKMLDKSREQENAHIYFKGWNVNYFRPQSDKDVLAHGEKRTIEIRSSSLMDSLLNVKIGTNLKTEEVEKKDIRIVIVANRDTLKISRDYSILRNSSLIIIDCCVTYRLIQELEIFSESIRNCCK